MTSIAPDPFADTAAGEPSAVPGRGGAAGGMGRSTDVYETLRLEVLEELGDHSADLQNAGTVQAVVRQVVDNYQARARQGLGIRALATPNEMVARLDRSLLEYGPLTPFLDGTIDYEELMIHGDEVTYIDGLGNLQSYDELTSEGEIRSIVARLLSTIGATVDDSRPIMQAQILGGRARIGVVIPPISDAINVTLRRYVVRRDTFADLIDWGSISPSVASLLTACTHIPTGIIICGQPGAGKTTLANALLDSAPPTTRVIACEDTPELRVAHLNGVSWRTRHAGPDGAGEVQLRDLVKMALGMRPDIIAVGETRGGEAYELTRAGNAGCGWMSTIHANSGRAAMQALISTAVMAGNNVPSQEVRAVFSSIVDLVVFLDREPLQLRETGTGTRRQIMEVLAVPPMQGSDTDVTVEPLFIREDFGEPLRWTGSPPPPDLERRLDKVCHGRGTTLRTVLDGRATLL